MPALSVTSATVAIMAVPGLSEEHLAATRSPRTLINSSHHLDTAKCIGNPRPLEAMGFGSSRFWKQAIISMAGPSMRLYWHQG